MSNGRQLSVLAQEKHHQYAGTRMGSDDTAHIAGQDLFHIGAFFTAEGFQGGGILRAVAVGDEYGFHIGAVFTELARQKLHGGLSAPALAHGGQLSLFVHNDNGLDVQHTAHKGGGGADPAAPLQVSQIVDGDPVTDMQFIFLHPAVQCINGAAPVAIYALFLHDEIPI